MLNLVLESKTKFLGSIPRTPLPVAGWDRLLCFQLLATALEIILYP